MAFIFIFFLIFSGGSFATETPVVQETHPFTLRARMGDRAEFTFEVKSPGEVRAEVQLKKPGKLLQILLVRPDQRKVRGKARGNLRYLATARATSDLVELGHTWRVILINFSDAEEVEGTLSIAYPEGKKGEVPSLPPLQEVSRASVVLTPFVLHSTPEQNLFLQVERVELEVNGIHLSGEYTLERFAGEKRVYLWSGETSSSSEHRMGASPFVMVQLTGISPGEYFITAHFDAGAETREIRLEEMNPSAWVEISGAHSLTGTGKLPFSFTMKVSQKTSVGLKFISDAVFFSDITLQKSPTRD